MAISITSRNHITVCICTYHRNQLLENLIRKLSQQKTDNLFNFSIVIVDNDITGPAKTTVMKLKEELNLEIEYDIEPLNIIPIARNRAIRLSKGNYIAIIDDDEFPPHQWLLNLYYAIQTFDVDGALGPVHPFFYGKPPNWLLKGNFCERPTQRTGTILNWNETRTGNLLLKREVFDKHNINFNEKFKTGGSDQEFFRQAIQAGCRFVAVKEAPVYEVVPPERWKKAYYIRRALVNGFNSHKYSLNQSLVTSHLAAPIKSSIAFLIYLLALPVCSIIGIHRLMQCMEKGCHHLSRLLALFGIELIKKRTF